jgi:hypothetical protein
MSYFFETGLGATLIDKERIELLESKIKKIAASAARTCPSMFPSPAVCFASADKEIKELEAQIKKIRSVGSPAFASKTSTSASSLTAMPGAGAGPNYLLYGGIAAGLVGLWLILRPKAAT